MNTVSTERDMATKPLDLNDIFGEDPMNPDKLHPDLKPYVEDGGILGTILRHPLVYQVPGPVLWKLANQQYELKMKLVDEALAKRDFGEALVYYERPYRLPTLLEWYRDGWFPTDTLGELLKGFWTDTEYPKQYGYRKLVNAFKLAGFLTDGPDKPTDRLVIYRGVKNRKDARGLSWTTRLPVAKFFARRFESQGPGIVYRAEISPQYILGMFDGRNESEVVLDPKGLESMAVVDM